MSKRDKEKTNKARRANATAKMLAETSPAERRPLSAYPKMGSAYDISQMFSETRCRFAGRLLVTGQLWDSVILSAPNHTEADWRLYDVAHCVKMICVGDERIEGAGEEWKKRQAAHGFAVLSLPPQMVSNRVTEFWFAVDVDEVLLHLRMKLVNLADANGNSDKIVMLGDEDETALLADRGLSPDDRIERVVVRVGKGDER